MKSLMPLPPLPADLPSIRNAQLPKVYESAKDALARCEKVDECQDWADKMAALASYAKQADDESLFTMAVRIQARAIRRCGELLKEVAPAKGKRSDLEPGGGAPPKLSRKEAASEAGLSRDQARNALRVANVPKEDFDEAVESEKPPTVTELAKRGTKPAPKPLLDLGGRDPAEFKASTGAQGYLTYLADTARKVMPDVVVRGAFEHERKRMRREAAEVMDWCRLLIKELGKYE